MKNYLAGKLTFGDVKQIRQLRKLEKEAELRKCPKCGSYETAEEIDEEEWYYYCINCQHDWSIEVPKQREKGKE